ncbi:MAG: hypothetical protein QNJ97_07215 [Myxococcota bacterium]|nr:hypothetical protein [Myxococcota bacterium]
MIDTRKKRGWKNWLPVPFVIVGWLSVMGNSGEKDDGPYQWSVVETTGPIRISIMGSSNSDEDVLLFTPYTATCLPPIRVSEPVHDVAIFDGREQRVAYAACDQNEDCITTIYSWLDGCKFDDASGDTDTSIDAGTDAGTNLAESTGEDLTGDRQIHCEADPDLLVFVNTKRCNDIFAIEVSTISGVRSRIKVEHYWKYGPSDEWDCSFPFY